MKIVAEDKAVESRTGDLLNEWEKAKPVEGSIKPSDALRQLQGFETKFSKLKEERDNVAKAKEALELQVSSAFGRFINNLFLKNECAN